MFEPLNAWEDLQYPLARRLEIRKLVWMYEVMATKTKISAQYRKCKFDCPA